MKRRGVFGTLDPFLEEGPVLGRRVANVGFLRFLLAADPFEAYHVFLADKRQRDTLEASLGLLAPGAAEAGRIRLFDRRELPRMLAATDYACFHQSDCIVQPTHIARLRNAHGRAVFPVTGPTHSLSYPDYPVAFLRHLWLGATPRDCIVATSQAGRAAVEAMFTRLRQGYGLGHVPGPSLRVVPLGLDPDQAAHALPDASDKAGLRRELGLPEEPVLILVPGRVSHASKMDVLPLLRALAQALDETEGMTRASAAVVLAGWADEGDPFPATLKELAGRLGITLALELRPGELRKARVMAACDICCSIADNPQETFGITLLEAQAHGLPVVASDYDGYRDVLQHEVTGLLVPTLGPDPRWRDAAEPAAEGCCGLPGGDFVDRLAPVLFDNQYHLLLAQRTAVCASSLARALGRLLADPAERARMGARGRERVRSRFLWPQIIARHLELWDELWSLPAPDIESLRAVPHPLHLAYAEAFAHYPARALHPTDRLIQGRAGQALLSGREAPVLYAGLDAVIDVEALRPLVVLARKGQAAGVLAAQLRERAPALSAELAAYHLLWALKHDLLCLEAEDQECRE